MNIRCLLGIHEPSKYTAIVFQGKQYKRCRRCGKLLEVIKQ